MNANYRFSINEAWEPYEPSRTNPWNNRLAAHLFRRAGFGAAIDRVRSASKAGLNDTLDQLFEMESAKSYDEEMAVAGRMVTGGQDSKGLAAWWLLKMAQSPAPLLEKMTLFWHGHFATSADKVNDARGMLRQHLVLRAHALGRFESLVRQISRDVAMLVYLDSTENRKTRPNENYARELMELFCLGPGNYTEHDIKEIARCFTGWEVRRNKFKFNSYQHDEGDKSFLGATGKFTGDDAIEIVLQQPAAARFIAKKLIRFFVFDDTPITDQLAEPVAKCLRENRFEIKPAMWMILRSKLFFSQHSIGMKLKSPVELAIGVLRLLGASVNMTQLADQLQRLGQLPLYPPNVKGWDGGRSWINASTVLARANLVEKIVASPATRYGAGSLGQWYAATTEGSDSLDWINELVLAQPVPPGKLATLRTEFQSSPSLGFSCLAALPEFQLN